MNMTIATYEQMKKYMDSFKTSSTFHSFITFKIRYYANSIDIMECFRYDIGSSAYLLTSSGTVDSQSRPPLGFFILFV